MKGNLNEKVIRADAGLRGVNRKMGAPLQTGLTPNSLADQTGKSGQQRPVFAVLMEVGESAKRTRWQS